MPIGAWPRPAAPPPRPIRKNSRARNRGVRAAVVTSAPVEPMRRRGRPGGVPPRGAQHRAGRRPHVGGRGVEHRRGRATAAAARAAPRPGSTTPTRGRPEMRGRASCWPRPLGHAQAARFPSHKRKVSDPPCRRRRAGRPAPASTVRSVRRRGRRMHGPGERRAAGARRLRAGLRRRDHRRSGHLPAALISMILNFKCAARRGDLDDFALLLAHDRLADRRLVRELVLGQGSPRQSRRCDAQRSCSTLQVRSRTSSPVRRRP